MAFSSKKVKPNNISIASARTLSNKGIKNPTRYDVKKDSLLDLQSYATTASNGQFCYDTDNDVMYQVLNGALDEMVIYPTDLDARVEALEGISGPSVSEEIFFDNFNGGAVRGTEGEWIGVPDGATQRFIIERVTHNGEGPLSDQKMIVTDSSGGATKDYTWSPGRICYFYKEFDLTGYSAAEVTFDYQVDDFISPIDTVANVHITTGAQALPVAGITYPIGTKIQLTETNSTYESKTIDLTAWVGDIVRVVFSYDSQTTSFGIPGVDAPLAVNNVQLNATTIDPSIFFDDFSSGDIISGGWTIVNSVATSAQFVVGDGVWLDVIDDPTNYHLHISDQPAVGTVSVYQENSSVENREFAYIDVDLTGKTSATLFTHYTTKSTLNRIHTGIGIAAPVSDIDYNLGVEDNIPNSETEITIDLTAYTGSVVRIIYENHTTTTLDPLALNRVKVTAS